MPRPEELWHQMLSPANVASECLAMDTRLISVEVLEPQLRLVGYAHVCSLRGICLRLSRRVAFALQWHWRHVVRRWQQWHSRLPPMRRIESDIRWQRPVHDGRLHRVATSWRRWVLLGLAVLGEMRTAVPHAWRPPLPAAVVLWPCRPIRCSRVRAQHLMRGCAPTRMSEATTSAAVPMVKGLRERETIRCKHFA